MTSAIDLSAITASDVTNLVTILMCIAVLVQSIRMMRSLRTMRESAMAEAAEALDRATAAANRVLHELKRTLVEDSAATADVLRQGSELREELIVMVGIANSVAERLVETSSSASAPTTSKHAASRPAVSNAPASSPAPKPAEERPSPTSAKAAILAAAEMPSVPAQAPRAPRARTPRPAPNRAPDLATLTGATT